MGPQPRLGVKRSMPAIGIPVQAQAAPLSIASPPDFSPGQSNRALEDLARLG